MIFSLQFILIFAGYGAVSNLSGNYMELYTGANDFQLGLYFMIPHFLHIARPFIGAQADRNQSHKRIYTWCALIASLSYIPYIMLPFLLQSPAIARVFTNKYRFWFLIVFHITGSIALNGCRTLADALAKNYAIRTNIEYVSMRKFAPVGLGLCSFLFGFLNEEWLMPDYVPAMVLFSACMLTLALVIHYWPDEYFAMTLGLPDEQAELPSTREILGRAAHKLAQPFKKQTSYMKQLKSLTSFRGKLDNLDTNSVGSFGAKSQTNKIGQHLSLSAKPSNSTQAEHQSLSLSQQLGILGLVLRRDFRISLAFLILLVGGWICRSAQNFVFVQLEDICETRKTCHPGKLSGYVLAGTSVLEFLTYITLNACRKFKLNRVLLLQLALMSLCIHYYFYGYLVEHLSTNWFLVESLHGFEFAIFITTSLSWGYSFANEVEYIIPELIETNVISASDDLKLVKVSLIATMMSCMTLLFEGFGSTLGSFTYGAVIQRYSFSTAWKINGSIALAEVLVIFAGLLLSRCIKIRPKMSKLKTESLRRKEGLETGVS